MGKINGCLKCLFIFFNVLYAILGIILVVGTVKISAYSHELSAVGSPGLGWMWVFAIGVLGISCLGIYSGCSEKILPLKIFAGFMGVGMVIMFIFGIIIAVLNNKVTQAFNSLTNEAVKPFLADDEMKGFLNQIQAEAECCGVVSVEDWENNIPDSCRCKSTPGSLSFGSARCTTKPLGARGPDRIYSEGCSQVILYFANLGFKIIMAFFFGFAVTALLGLLISLLMVHQVKRHDGAGGSSLAMKGY